jgi:hypothetical protein
MEVVNRKTDNTMSRKNMTKGLTTINKALHNKLLIEEHDPTENRG